LLGKALELVQSFKFEASIIDGEQGRNFVRMQIGGKHLDFYIKEIKNRFIKEVWLCKKANFSPHNNYLVFIAKEERWVVTTGQEIDRKGEYRESDRYRQHIEMVVVPMEIFRPAKAFFEAIRKRYDDMLQRKMTEWTPKSI